MIPPQLAGPRFLAAGAADLGSTARFVATLNDAPATQCLHCPPGSASAVSAFLRREEDFPGGWHRWFFKAVDAQERITGLVGCQPDTGCKQGWVWGPWALPTVAMDKIFAPLMAEMLRALPTALRQLDAFVHVQNRQSLNSLHAAGFAPRPVTHIYTALEGSPRLRADTHLMQPPHGMEELPYLRPAHEIAFVNLHAASFPASTQSGEQLLSERDDNRVILAASNGLRLLGYICVSVNHTPREGFIDYFAVKSSARGRGVGRWLLAQALRWIFEEQRLPQAALCVTDWRDDARRLYERVGFRLSATGVGARLHLGAR